MDKAAVLHYARIRSKSGQYVNCECCFTVVHNVLVASTSIYFKGEKSESMSLPSPSTCDFLLIRMLRESQRSTKDQTYLFQLTVRSPLPHA